MANEIDAHLQISWKMPFSHHAAATAATAAACDHSAPATTVHLPLKAIASAGGFLNGRSVVYCASATCVFVSAARVFCREGSGVENALWINANRADNRSFSESRRSSNLRDACKAGGAGRGRASQSFPRTKRYFLLKVLVEIFSVLCHSFD